LFLKELSGDPAFKDKVVPHPNNPISNQGKLAYYAFMNALNVPTAGARAIHTTDMQQAKVPQLQDGAGSSFGSRYIAIKQVLSMGGEGFAKTKRGYSWKNHLAKLVNREVPYAIAARFTENPKEWKVAMVDGRITEATSYDDCRSDEENTQTFAARDIPPKVKELARLVYRWYKHMPGAVLSQVRIDILSDKEGQFFLNELECECATGLEDWRCCLRKLCLWLLRQVGLQPPANPGEEQEEEAAEEQEQPQAPATNPRKRKRHDESESSEEESSDSDSSEETELDLDDEKDDGSGGSGE
jgi:hypothetical protein